MTPIHLPYPPTLNTSKVPINGRQISSLRYRRWRVEAMAMIAQQRPQRIKGDYRMTIVAIRPDRRRRDLDNIIKPCGDALVNAQIVEDDSLAQSIFVRWSDGEPDKRGGVRISLEAA